MTTNTAADQQTSIVAEEYKSLRDEILKRIEIRYALRALAITALGAIVAFALNRPDHKEAAIILLLSPFLVLCLAASWAHNTYEINRINQYLKTEHKSKWESTSEQYKETTQDLFLRIINNLIFTFSAIIPAIIGIILIQQVPDDKISQSCISLSVIFIGLTFFFSLYNEFYPKEEQQPSSIQDTGSSN